ncbi:MAG: N-6 DNA methylase, partial [bacterium]|nr:N-6 DNA methylase [bacterium]
MSGLNQPTLFDFFDKSGFAKSSEVVNAVEELASNSGGEVRGAIYTRIEVVDFILDLAGYTKNHLLYHKRILEPSFGEGDFLLPIVDRLLSSWWEYSGNTSSIVEDLKDVIRAVELHRKTYESTRQTLIKKIVNSGVPVHSATVLSGFWLIQGDFLLEQMTGQFDFVVGNPPYVRQELIPAPLLAEYRQLYSTMYDRADLYVPFIERSLSLLNKGGVLGFICADRWMKNRYGGPLRNFISRQFYLKAYVDMEGSSAFHSEVSAYPAITIISNDKPGATRIAHR